MIQFLAVEAVSRNLPLYQMSLLLRDQWGPALWTVLHTLAECSGRFTRPVESQDEVVAWVGLFRTLQDIMPCQLCRDHFVGYSRAQPIRTLTYLNGAPRKEWIQNFWWNLHNKVNQQSEKPVYPRDILDQYKPSEAFGFAYLKIKQMTNQAVQQGQLKQTEVKNAWTYLEKLARYYGLK